MRFNYTGEIARLIDSDYRRRDQIIHAIRAGHYGNLTFIDEQIGRVIEALERRGELDDTVVLWTSDHGSHLGDHDLIHKGTHYDASARVPLVVRHPDRVDPGVRDGFTAHVDLMPTILSLAGAPLPEAMEGRDLTPVLEGTAPSVQDEVFIEIRGSTSIVTDRWKLGLYPHDGEGDLYDLEDDPYELINRFEDGDYGGVREELSERIREFSPEWPPAFSVVNR